MPVRAAILGMVRLSRRRQLRHLGDAGRDPERHEQQYGREHDLWDVGLATHHL